MAARIDTIGNSYLQHTQQQPQPRHSPGTAPQVYALYPVVKHRRKASLTPSSPSSPSVSPMQQPPPYHSLNPLSSPHRSDARSNAVEQISTQQYTQSTAVISNNDIKSNSNISDRDHSGQSTKRPSCPEQKHQSKSSPASPVSAASSSSSNASRVPSAVSGVRDIPQSTANTRYEQRQLQQQPKQQPHFGGAVPREAASPTKARGLRQEQVQEQGSALASSTQHNRAHNRGQGASQHPATPSTLNTAVSRQASPLTTPTSPSPSRTDKPELVTTIPSSSLFLSFDADPERDHAKDQDKHQRQALQYQQRLRQKPPKKRGDGDTDDDDSDSGSIVSYRRSIQRLSMSYHGKGRAGVPNIGLFAPNQRPNHLVKHDRSGSAGSEHLAGAQIMIKEQREEKARQQREKDRLQEQQEHRQQQQDCKSSPNQSHFKSVAYGSTSSLASIDEHTKREDGPRPRIVRANTTNDPPTQGIRDVQVPERSTSADNIIYDYDGGNRPRQGSQSSQMYQNPRNQQRHDASPPSAQANRGQYEPRPSHESAQSQRSNYSRTSKQEHLGALQTDYRQGPAGSDSSRSKSPTRAGALSPVGGDLPFRNGNNGGSASHYPLLVSCRSPGGYGPGPAPPGFINLHPAHHIPSGGYVRPEEAVGPSNPMPEKAEDYVRKGIEYHELGEISKATHYFRTAAEIGDPVGMLMYGLSVRHGWGCTANRVLAFQYLQKSAEHAVGDLNSRDSFASTAAKGELVLAIYELGICFRHGWGIEKNKKTAAYYFEIAANLGDPDAQNDLAWCYYHGIGVKKDMYKSAKYYRLAAAQGMQQIGNSWIWKDKYGGPTSPTPAEKSHTK